MSTGTETALTEAQVPKVGRLEITEEHAREVGLPSPAAVNYMMSIANMLYASALITPDMEPSRADIAQAQSSGMTPADIQIWREKTIKANAMAKMLIGREMSIDAMASLQDIDIVKGRIFVRYPQLIAQIERKGYEVTWEERSEKRAALRCKRANYNELFEFTIDDARRAGLMDGKPEYNQYILRPRVMLCARCASEAYRMTGGRANVYTPEEKAEVISRPEHSSEPEPAGRPEGKYTVEAKAAPSAAETTTTSTSPVVEKVVEISKPNGAAPPESASPASVNPTPAPPQPEATKGRGRPPKAQPEPDPNEGKVVYEIHVIGEDGKPALVLSENPYRSRQSAEVRAQALANQTGKKHEVVENAGGERITKSHHEPAPAPPVNPPATAPAEPAKAPAEESDGKVRTEWQKRAKAVVRKVADDPAAKGIPEKTIESRVATFLVCHLGLKGPRELPKDDAVYVDALPDLEAVAAQDVNVLLSEPAEQGRRMAADNKAFREAFDSLKWPAETQALARAVARSGGLSQQDFHKYLETVCKDFDFEPLPDLNAFFRLALKTRMAGKFYREVKGRNQSMALVLEQLEQRGWGGPVENADRAVIEAALDKFKEANKEAGGKKKQEPDPPPPPKPVEEESGGLFGDED